jgi:DNA-binding response OmpR family regulator
VLLVDDDAAVRGALHHQLTVEGFEVQEASNGFAALEQMLSYTPDIVITDIEMPGLTGSQFVLLMRDRPALAHVPVIFISANIDMYRECLRHIPLGLAEYLRKPLDVDLLVTCVQALSDHNRALALTPTTSTAPCLVSPDLSFAAEV